MANMKITDYTQVIDLGGNEFLLISQDGVYKKVTLDQIRNLATDITNTELADLVGKVASATDVKNILATINASLSERVQKTTANITYYVNASVGNDSNDGLTSGTAFKTIAKAISMLPQVINHTVNINLATGTYNESIVISGFMGKGYLGIKGASSLSDSFLVSNVQISKCNLPIEIVGIKCTSSTLDSIGIAFSSTILLSYIKSDVVATSINGLLASYSKIKISNSLISNKSIGIGSFSNSEIYSENNSGTGNIVGLQSIYNSTIGKNGTQPAGTTAESSNTGGVIR